jgi:hypothetical protein
LSVLTPVDRNDRRRRRRRASRRRYLVRRLVALSILVAVAAGFAYGAHSLRGHGGTPAASVTKPKVRKARTGPRALPAEMRGVHVTMALAGIRGKLGDYVALRKHGLNTVELDVKDESGNVAFVHGAPALALATGAAKPYYKPEVAARELHKAGLYVIGRIVTFQDPVVSVSRPGLALQNPDGSVWRTNAGYGWLNPYDRRVWTYDVAIAKKAVRAGFDEIQFDYVRFPSDGDVSAIHYPVRTRASKARTITQFVRYASRTIHKLGARVSVDVFGLAATRDLGIGQQPQRLARYVDAVYPMVYPSHFNPGEYGLADPNDNPGRTVTDALLYFETALDGTSARLVPWLQDFSLGRTYTTADLRAQVDAARSLDTRGFLLWNPLGIYTAGALSGRGAVRVR